MPDGKGRADGSNAAQRQLLPEMPNEKGQVMSYDLIFAVSVYLVLFALMVGILSNNLNETAKARIVGQMRQAAFEAANVLVLTPGMPSTWQAGLDVNRIGLVYEPRVISGEKLDAFSAMDYGELKEIFNIQDYNFYVKIERGVDLVFEKGSQAVDAEYIVNATRMVNYNGDEAVLYFRLYK